MENCENQTLLLQIFSVRKGFLSHNQCTLYISDLLLQFTDTQACPVIYNRLGRKGVNFGNSLMASGVCYTGSKDEDVVKYFGEKKLCLPLPNLI